MSPRLLTTIILAAATSGAAHVGAQSSATLSARERVVIASTIFHHVKTYFPDLSAPQFDRDYSAYVADILGSDDRHAFDRSTMALVATLHDGHSWFADAWLDSTTGQSNGFTVYRWDSQWVVVRSRIASLSAGDVIEAIDGAPTEAFFEQNRQYISASSERDAATSLFDTPILFPARFTATLTGGRQVTIDRAHDEKRAGPPVVDGRWLVPDRVGYVRMAAFQGIETSASAWRYLLQFHDAAAVILDLRGNIGGGDPIGLQAALMSKPYLSWSEAAQLSGGPLLRGYGVSHPGMTHVTVQDTHIVPHGPTYSGRLIILIDRACSCACEDFTMPFKVTKRAQLIGEATAGTFSFTSPVDFENGMRLNVAAVRHTFPDGSRFEGVGITPDIEVRATPQDLKSGRDVVLDRALAEATRR